MSIGQETSVRRIELPDKLYRGRAAVRRKHNRSVPRPDHHWLQAAVIGGFGRREGGSELRQAVVAVRRKGSATARQATAESVAYEKGLYMLKDPQPGVDANLIDELWITFEPRVPGAIGRLAAGRASPEDEADILTYVAALGVRHPVYFPGVVRRHVGARGLQMPEGDALQVLRLFALQNGVSQVFDLRWRVLESPEGAPRFVLNDGGFSMITEQGRTENGLFVPLGPRIALLGDRDARPGLQDRRVLTPMSVGWLNAATWEEDWPSEVYSHPDDREMLLALGPTARAGTNRDGPYRGLGRSHTLFADRLDE